MAGRKKTANFQVAEHTLPVATASALLQPDTSRDDLMRAVVENAPVIMFALDRDGTIIFIDGAPNRTGLTVPEVMNVSVYDLLELSREEITAGLEQVLSGEQVSRTIELRGASFEARLTPSRDSRGTITGVLGVLHDITERVQTEAALRRQNAYLAALHHVTLALVNRLDVNDLLQTIISQAPPLVGTDNGYLYLVEPDRERLRLRFGAGVFADKVDMLVKRGEGAAGVVWNTGQALMIEHYQAWPHRVQRFNDLPLHSIAAVPLKSRDEIVGVLGVASGKAGHRFSDEEVRQLEQFAELASIALDNARLYTAAQQELAERKRTEAALRESEERYRTIIESIEDGYYETDLAGNLRFLNDACVHILGLGSIKEEVIGQRYLRFADEAEGERISEALKGVLRTGRSIRALDARVRGLDGELRSLEVSASLIRDVEGKPAGYRGIVRDVTDRKQIELALQTSEERYRSVIASMAEGILVYDAEGGIVAHNDAALGILHLEGQTITGQRSLFEMLRMLRKDGTPFPTDEHPALLTLRSGEAKSNIVASIETGSGEPTWISINSQPIFHKGEQKPHAVVISFSDISESKHHAEALARSELRNKTLLQAIPDMMYVLTREGRYVEVNVEDKESLPLPSEQLIGASIFDVPLGTVAPDTMMAYIEEAAASGEMQAFEYVVERAEASGYYEVRMGMLNADEVLVIVRDMTDRHQAIMELSKRINQLATLQLVDDELTETLDVNHVMEVALDAVTQVSEADAGFIALADEDHIVIARTTDGYPLLVGSPLPDESTFNRVMETREPSLIVDMNALRESTLCLPGACAQIVMPLVSHDALIGIMNIETRREHVFNDELFDFLALLISRVAVALDNARLYDNSQKHLTEVRELYHQVSDLEQLKTHMIRVAAHDLRSPLGVVSGYIAILKEELGEKTEEYAMFLKPIDRAIDRMQQMATDILSLERVHSAQNKVSERLNLRELVERALLDSREQAVLKSLVLSSSVIEGDAVMMGDPVQLYEAVSNLIGNAIKYTSAGGSIDVYLHVRDGKAVFEVKDTGMGVPAEHQAKLFQPFFRVKTEETRQIDGTGLGLYLVKSIIDRHAGEMIFSSVHKQGSTFGFSLPLEKTE